MRYLLLLLSLLTLNPASGQGIQKLKIKLGGVETKAQVRRDLSIYPRTSAGFAALKAAAESSTRPFAVTITSGARAGQVLAALGIPTLPTAPAWISGLRYSYTGGVLTIEGAGAIGRMKFERSDNVPFTTTNPDGVTIQSGTFYGFGPLIGQGSFDRQWALSGVTAIPLRLTAEQSDASATYAVNFTPVTGAQRASLIGGTTTSPPSSTTTAPSGALAFQIVSYDCQTGALAYKLTSGSSTAIALNLQGVFAGNVTPNATLYHTYPSDAKTGRNTVGTATQGGVQIQINFTTSCTLGSTPVTPPVTNPPATGTYANITRGFVMGNSFTSHTAETAIGWNQNNGMAASSYATSHTGLIEAAFKTVNSSFELISSGIGSSFETGYYGSNSDRYEFIVNNIKSDINAKWGANATVPLFIFSIGENMAEENWNEAKFLQGLDYLLNNVPISSGGTILLRNGVWLGQASANTFLSTYISRSSSQAIATARNFTLKYASMDDIRETVVNGQRTSPYYSSFSNAGVQRHYGDAGHAAMATRMLNQLRINSTGTPPVVTASNRTYDYPIVPVGSITFPDYNSTQLSGEAGTYTIGEVARLENANLQVEIRRFYGGATQVTDKRTGRKLINWSDHGRQAELCLYSGPKSFALPGGGQYEDIGWNLIPVGNHRDVPAPVLAAGFVTGNDGKRRFYTKTQGISWASGAVGSSNPPKLLEGWVEKWTALTGDEVDTKTRITLNRTDETFYDGSHRVQLPNGSFATEGIGQEFPNLFIAGSETYTRWYNGNAPYTGGGVRTSSFRESGSRSFSDDAYFLSEPWTAIEYDRAGHHIFLNTESMAVATGNVSNYIDLDHFEGNDPLTVTRSSQSLHLDPKGTIYHDYGWYITPNFEEGRAWANARPRRHGDVPNWVFNAVNGRNQWTISNGYDQKEPFSAGDNWRVTMVPSADGGPATARRSELASPFVIHKASSIPVIYIRMKYSGPATQMRIEFIRNGQRNRGLDSDRPNQMGLQYPNGQMGNQNLTFNPIRDGQFHTYAISTTGNSEWRDVIQQYKIKYADGPTIGQNDSFEISYFGVNNPGN